MHLTSYPQGAFALVGFLGEKVSAGGLPESDLAGAADLEGLLGPGMGLYLWHEKRFSVYPAGVPAQAENLWDLVG